MRFALITAAALSAGILVGCKDDTTTTTPPAKPPATQAATQPSMADKVQADADAAAKKAADAAAKAEAGAEDAAGKVKEGTEDAAGKVKEGTEDAASKIKAGAEDAAKGEDAAMPAKNKEAQKLHDQATAAMKKKDYTAAEAAVKKLEAMDLSAEWETKVKSLKASLETSKKASDVKIPGSDE